MAASCCARLEARPSKAKNRSLTVAARKARPCNKAQPLRTATPVLSHLRTEPRPKGSGQSLYPRANTAAHSGPLQNGTATVRERPHHHETRPPLRITTPHQKPWLHVDRRDRPGPRHRRQHRDIQRRECCAPPPALLLPARAARHDLAAPRQYGFRSGRRMPRRTLSTIAIKPAPCKPSLRSWGAATISRRCDMNKPTSAITLRWSVGPPDSRLPAPDSLRP
jgi:hypothetical protein